MTYPIEIRSLRPLANGQPRVSAVFAFRHDAALVPDLLLNLSPIVHEAVIWDDRGEHGLHSNEPDRRKALLSVARQNGAEWILAVDPDERFEAALAERITELTEDPARRVMWNFALREMFSPNAWRADGVWGHKMQMRLFPVHAVQDEAAPDLHGRWVEPQKGYRNVSTGLNLYHFHHVTAEKGQARRDTYARLDPDRRHNAIGYDYLADRRELVLQEIPQNRAYQPLWREELVTPVKVEGSDLPADPVHTRLRFIDRSLRQKGRGAAALWAKDLAALDPEDSDLGTMAKMLGPQETHAEPELWRRWVAGAAKVHEGGGNGQGPLSVIVLGFRAQKEMRDVVKALAQQSSETEIVVVNSGGGAMRALLGDLLDRVRLIEVEEPLFVGAARNIGIDASLGRWVSFLAGDCTPEPGWVAGRLARHAAGAVSVASSVRPQRLGTLVAAVMWSMRFFSRDPGIAPEKAQLFGRSFDRQVLMRLGYFMPGLRQGEDDEFNQRLDRMEPTVWAPEIRVRHKDPRLVLSVILDAWRRGRRFRPSKATSLAVMAQRRLKRVADFQMADLPEDMRLGPVSRLLLPLCQRLFMRAYVSGLSYSAPSLAEAEALRKAAAVQLKKGHRKAVELAREAVRKDPQSAKVWLMLGDVLARFGRNDRGALDAWTKAMGLEATNPLPLTHAVDHLLGRGRAEQAVDLATRALVLAPAEPALQAIAARAALAADGTEKALHHLRQALCFDATNPERHLALADLHEARGDKVMAAKRRAMAESLRRTL
ncbi:glycosyltransferase [Neogemmobacter tilapiae]|uniref:glycosyltransferase n=1 Tax=Neogemmobacter tilapiae TaxID=875041 RepID=UPI001673A338|nr:glycosyltransferase [Gemmobacter tilapiae]